MPNVDVMQMFTYTLAGALTLLLIKMGTTIKYENIDIKHPKLFAIVFLHQYILDPLYVLILAILMKPPLYQVYGMFTVILTPATAASSVSAYTVDADVPFALALSIASLVQSILLTPILFTLMMTVYAARVKEASNAIKMPYFRMFILMSYVIMIIGIGYKMRQKMRSDLVDKIGYYFQNGSIILLFTSMGFFFSSKEFARSFSAKNPYSYYGSMILITTVSLFKAHIPICNEEPSKKDAAVLVIFRKSPGLAMAIAAMSFSNMEMYGSIIGYVFLYNFIRDWITMPYLMGLRKKRLGHYFFSSVKREREAQESESCSDASGVSLDDDSSLDISAREAFGVPVVHDDVDADACASSANIVIDIDATRT